MLEPPSRSRASRAGYRRDEAGYPRDQADDRRDQGRYPRDRGRYPREQAAYSPDQGGYPREQVGNPPDQSRYPRDQGRYSGDQPGYPPDRGRYPREQAGDQRGRSRYPPDQAGYPREQGGGQRGRSRYPPDQAGYPPDQAGYPPDQAGYPREQAGDRRGQSGYRRDQPGFYPRDRADWGGRMPEADAGKPRRFFGWGHYPARTGVLMVLAATLLGVVFTVATHRDPGLALGIFVAGGTVGAGISVRSRSAYAIIPVPALTYAAAAVIAGFIHDHAVDTSHTALALSAAQWFADGFPAMATATALAVLITVARWLLSRLRKRSSHSHLARGDQPARRAGPGRSAADARLDREDSARTRTANFRQPGDAPPAARPSRRRTPPPW